MEITLEIPDELATQLTDLENQLPEILKIGLDKLHSQSQSGFEDFSDVLEVLVGFPTPEEVLALRPSKKLQLRIDELLEKNRANNLLPEEQKEWDQYAYLEHIVRMAKIKATAKLKAA